MYKHRELNNYLFYFISCSPKRNTLLWIWENLRTYIIWWSPCRYFSCSSDTVSQ